MLFLPRHICCSAPWRPEACRTFWICSSPWRCSGRVDTASSLFVSIYRFFLLIGRFNSSTSGDICHLIQSQASGHPQQSHDPSIPTHFLKVHMVEIEQSLSWCGFWDGGMVTIPPLARITYRLTGEESEYKSQLRLNLKGYPKIKN